MKFCFVSVAVLLAIPAICSGQALGPHEMGAGPVDELRGAPFFAEIHGGVSSSSDSRESTLEVARSEDGSVYQSYYEEFSTKSNPDPSFRGYRQSVAIDDVPDNCTIYIYPFLWHATGDGGGTGQQMSITLESRAARLYENNRSVEDNRKLLRRMQQPQTGTASRRAKSLGERKLHDTILFGFSDNVPNSDGQTFQERWESDLGFTYSKNFTFSDGHSSNLSVTTLKLGAPDPQLFTVQHKYFPPTNSFRTSSTLFLTSSAVSDDVRRRVESIFTASGHFASVHSPEAADILIDLAGKPPAEGHVIRPQIILNASMRRGRQQLVRISLIVRDAPDQWADSPVLNTCLARLWSQIENMPGPSQAPENRFLKLFFQ